MANMELCLKKRFIISPLFFSFLFLVSIKSFAYGSLNQTKTKYRTNFGSCPSRIAGQMSMRLIKNFEKRHSLHDLRGIIDDEELAEGHFVSEYKINYDPVKNALSFNFKCPKPLMKVQVYKKNGLDSYEAILVDTGELFDPTYEVLLRGDRKLVKDLPFLALPVRSMEKGANTKVTQVVKEMGSDFRSKVSEVILDDKGELTVIMSLRANPSSVFMGKGDWLDKTKKLKRIIKNMEKNKRIPAIINLVDAKKIVVKFNTNI